MREDLEQLAERSFDEVLRRIASGEGPKHINDFRQRRIAKMMLDGTKSSACKFGDNPGALIDLNEYRKI